MYAKTRLFHQSGYKLKTGLLHYHFFYHQHVDYDEEQVYNNHFWQRTIYCMFQVGLMFQDKYPIAKEMLQYYYELWSTRGPVGGFSRDGQHFYSSSYFNLDMYGLYYKSGMLSYLTGKNFLEHPWYQNSGQALLYSWPPLSKSGGFGDGNEINGVKKTEEVSDRSAQSTR